MNHPNSILMANAKLHREILNNYLSEFEETILNIMNNDLVENEKIKAETTLNRLCFNLLI